MSTTEHAKGLLVVVSSPSGAGKTTICRRLLGEFGKLCFSVSCTTRQPRQGERDGVDYRFVSPAEFQRMVEAGEFAEFADVHGNRYGTPRSAVSQALDEGKDVLFDIDWQGGKQLRAKFADDAVMIWILPPSLRVLEERLRRRATDSIEAIERRLATAKQELLHYDSYDYLVVNDDLDRAYDETRAIYLAAHRELRRARPDAQRLLGELGIDTQSKTVEQ
ncbi:MAG: guanylate kinase [Pseudomonadota bacterium]